MPQLIDDLNVHAENKRTRAEKRLATACRIVVLFSGKLELHTTHMVLRLSSRVRLTSVCGSPSMPKMMDDV